MISVLLIEDNDVDARLTQDLLAEWSVEEFKVTHAKTLSDGLAYIDKGRFDAILLDLSLPDAFGLPTVRQVHATNPSIPVVVLSGVSDQSLALQAVQQGAQDYLVKGQGHPELLALDRFKSVNDTLGHDVGDELLKAVAERLKGCVREVDTVARMGGDEFTIILEGVASEQSIVVVAKRITESITSVFPLKGHTVSVGISIGITVY